MRRAIWMALALGTAPLVALAQQGGAGQTPATQQPAGSPSGTGSLQQGQDDTTGMGPAGAPGQQAAGTVGATQGQPATGGAGDQGAGEQQSGQGGSGVVPQQRPVETAGQVATQQPTSPEAMQRELSDLRQRVTRLERQLADQNRGTGGAGTGGADTGGTADIRVQGPVAVASVTFDGTVRAVSSNHIIVADPEDGTLYDLRIDQRTRVFDDGKPINPRQLSEGMPVRTSFAYIDGDEHARDILVIDEEEQRLRQQQQQRQQQQRMGPGQQTVPPPQGQQRTPRR